MNAMREPLRLDVAANALLAIPADLPRDDWVRVGMAAHAAGLDFDTFNEWSGHAPNYNERAALDTWRSFKNNGNGIGPGTLIHIAKEHGWQATDKPQHRAPAKAPTRPAEPPRKPSPGMSPTKVWARCIEATAAHSYIATKQGIPHGLRVVPDGDALRIAGQSMAGALVVPAFGPDGDLQSLQFVTASNATKLNLPRAQMSGASFTVGPPDGPAYLCEGVGQAWACWQATGHRAVVCFGWDNVRHIAESLREREPTARLVLVPDVGKEADAQKIAREVGAAVAYMPQGESKNFDANDLMRRDGYDVLATLLEGAREPRAAEQPPPRYRLLSAIDLHELPRLAWVIHSVLPRNGCGAIFGPSTAGKSFLALDMTAAGAEGGRWFGHKIKRSRWVYVALEGQFAFRQRVEAWERFNDRPFPEGPLFLFEPFKLTDREDVLALAAAIHSAGGADVIVIDTLNRAAPEADENSSQDMGRILEGVKELQALTGSLVLLVHHTGKDASKGMRGHSSLFAALDATIEVSRADDRREWKVGKAKDGEDGQVHPFRLKVVNLGENEEGDQITSCVVAAVDDEEQDATSGRARPPKGGNQKIVYDALGALFRASPAFGRCGAPPLRPCITIEDAITATRERLAVEPKRRGERARQAITGLIATGVLGSNEGWIWLK